MGSQLNPDSLLEAGFTKIPKSSILDENEEEKMKISNAKEKKKKKKNNKGGEALTATGRGRNHPRFTGEDTRLFFLC